MPTTQLHLGSTALSLSFLIFAMAGTPRLSFGEERVVYKCGPYYTDNITAKEAIAQGCKTLEGAPIAAPKYKRSTEIRQPSNNWSPLGGDLECQNFFDRSTRAPSGQHMKAWIMTTCSVEQDVGRLGVKSWLSRKSLIYFNCPSRSYQVVQRVDYADVNGSGPVTESRSVKARPDDFVEVVPDSQGEGWLASVCDRPKKK